MKVDKPEEDDQRLDPPRSRRAVSPNRRTVSRTGAVDVDMQQILEMNVTARSPEVRRSRVRRSTTGDCVESAHTISAPAEDFKGM